MTTILIGLLAASLAADVVFIIACWRAPLHDQGDWS